MLIIRLRQQGAKNRQTYRLVVTDERSPLDGKYVEKLGWYNPHAEESRSLQIDAPRMLFWIDQGAQVSDRVKALVKRVAPEVVQHVTAKRVARRAKARIKRQKQN
jgi:small subunit ribosomal protein S16